MIGTYLTLDLPSLSDTFSNAVSKTATALSSLRDSVADAATPSAIDINSALGFNGNWAQDVGGVILADGNAPSSVGSIYYHNGEFYAIDSTGTVQLTAAGALNIASAGTIGGDYGGANPAAVVYNATNNEYRFYENETLAEWGGLVAANIKLEGSAGSLRFIVPAGATGDHDVTLPPLPAGQLVLQMDATGTITTSNTLAADLYLGSYDTHHTAQHESTLSLVGYPASLNTTAAGLLFAGTTWTSQPHGTWGMRTGDRLQQLALYWGNTPAGSYTVTVYKGSLTTGSAAAVQQWTTTPAIGKSTYAITSPAATVSDDFWFVQITAPSGATVSMGTVKFDRP